MSLTEADKNAARFMREVRIMARLSSPNLPRTIAGGLDGDQPYLAMEYIDGVTAVVAARRGGRRPAPCGLGCRDRRADRDRASTRRTGPAWSTGTSSRPT